MEREKINWGSVIKVGNKVRIREFDEMEKQYGYRYFGDPKVINVFMSFTAAMKKIMKREDIFIIKDLQSVQIC